MEIQALGLIEVRGYLGAVSAADAALKAANVQLLRSEKIKGGMTTIELTGDVGAVQAAVSAGRAAVESMDCLLSSHVIPRPDQGIKKILLDSFEVIKSEKAEPPVEVSKTDKVETQEFEAEPIEKKAKTAGKKGEKNKKEPK